MPGHGRVQTSSPTSPRTGRPASSIRRTAMVPPPVQLRGSASVAWTVCANAAAPSGGTTPRSTSTV